MTHTMTFLLGLVFLLAAIVANGIDFSDAVTASAADTGRVTPADTTPPTVTLAGPGAPVRNWITVAAAASDAESGVTSVAIQYLAPAASTWTTLCTDTTAPYRCAWNTEHRRDGHYQLRAHAVDGAGHTADSDPVHATVTVLAAGEEL
ncbi:MULTISPECIES: Ig-like domain-containing protein [Nocardioides]|uniref:Ig-like domain-containing protein n=1 Tax=Nocardioides vastitatis TaxID=2568655 RepID=A0ABW0ZJU6_9ACTN|nr:Ig-like domain-containing protein [Nocardioides sp.]THI92344.1 hypothetical protein E7Z54_21985 [Nocardioides sp.]